MALYRLDAEEYLKVPFEEMDWMAATYSAKYAQYSTFSNPDDYYRSLGPEQIARQVFFHHHPWMVQQMEQILRNIDTSKPAYALDFGCGSAPIGFELAMRGHKMDFVDIDGTPAYEFTKWRAKKRNIEDRCGWSWNGPYDYILALDSIEHIKDWKPIIDRMAESLNDNGVIITNFMLNQDYENAEHVNMDKRGVTDYLVSKGIYPLNQVVWIKRNLGFMDRKPTADSSAA
jgi:2-polyprenyl-3-methyl-5-hydroxy-6-metoxy-1,4-benzoquinol methylase